MSFFDEISKGYNSLVQSVTSYNADNGKFGDYKGSFFDQIAQSVGGNGGDNIGNKFLNVVGYNGANGKWGGKGSDVDWLNEGFGQINGANAQRHALGVAGDAAIAAKKAQDILIAQQQEEKRLQDVQASNQAGAIRATSTARSNSAFGDFTPPAASKLGADTTNFLGR